MQFRSMAKPVRIRIQSGGEEHSSLESLKRNFCLDDVVPLLDGRLNRWLLGLNQQDLAAKIENLDADFLNDEAGTLAFLRLFFEVEFAKEKLNSLQEVIRFWLNDPVYKQNGHYLLKRFAKSNADWRDITLAKEAYKLNLLPDKNWRYIFEQLLPQADAELYFLYGKLLYDSSNANDQQKGLEYIEKAAKEEFAEAKTWLKDQQSSGLQGFEDEVRKEVMEIVRKAMGVKFVKESTPIVGIDKNMLKNELLSLYNIGIFTSDVVGYTTVGALVDFIMTKLPKPDKLEKDLREWKNRCVSPTNVYYPDLARLQSMLKTQHQINVSTDELYQHSQDVYSVIKYVKSKIVRRNQP